MCKYTQIGYVSTEGGPLLIGDYTSLIAWNGIENTDYNSLIHILKDDDILYTINNQDVVVWDPEGGATISVHRKENTIILVRSFEALEQNNKYTQEYQHNNFNSANIGTIIISSGTLLILYATESGALSTPLENQDEILRLEGDFAFETSNLAIPVKNGTYLCMSDFVYENDDLYKAKRLILTYLEK